MRDSYEIREATPADLPVIMRHRRAMFEDMGSADAAKLEAALRAAEPLIERGLRDGTYRGWLACLKDGDVVAGAGVWTTPWLPSPRSPRPVRTEVVNVYTEPAHRRHGLARRLMETVLEWSRLEGRPWVTLHASDDGRPLYADMGFAAGNEMGLAISPPASSATQP